LKSEVTVSGHQRQTATGKTILDALSIRLQDRAALRRGGDAYDSLAEAYAKNGQKQQAIDNYRKCLELDPKNQDAANKLKELEQK
jgi:Tfp pilus assembly protein PilF